MGGGHQLAGIGLLGRVKQRQGLAFFNHIAVLHHHLAVIRAMAHRVMVMQNGDVVEEGETLALFDAPQQSYTRELMAAAHLA